VRLVTLTGPGGTGKTRLALQAAAEASDEFPDGVWWVPLAPIRDAPVVVSAVAQALDFKEPTGRSLLDALGEWLAGRRLLIVLDNAEHLLPDLAQDVSRLHAVDGPSVVVTSRERLQVAGEHVYPVTELNQDDGVELFLARAKADAGVRLEPDEAVAELCARLEQLPLALELAAARTVVFTPEELLGRLGGRLDLLKGGRDADPRQQTLRATIEWSYHLLHPAEQQLLRRLSVFAGGCRYDAAEQIAGADPDVLQSLLDKSLLRRRKDSAGDTRYWMLETIREFAAECLTELDEIEELRERFVDFHVRFATDTRPCWYENPEDPTPLARFREDLSNIRIAVERALESGRPNAALEIATYLGWCWQVTGLLPELDATLLRIHEHADGDGFGAGPWACSQLQLAVVAAETGSEECVPLLRACLPLLAEAGFPHEHALMLCYLAQALAPVDPDEALARAREAEIVAREVGNTAVVGDAVGIQASLALERGDDAAGTALFEQLLVTASPDTYSRMIVLLQYSNAGIGRGRTVQALQMLDEARAIATELGFERELLHIEALNAYAALLDGDADSAEECIARARPEADKAGRLPLLAQLTLAEAGARALRADTRGARALWQAAVDQAAAADARWDAAERRIQAMLLEPLTASDAK
jgi:predicted ATPase